MPFDFSDDCLNCLCGLPHSWEEHMKAVNEAMTTLHDEIAELEAEIADLEWD